MYIVDKKDLDWPIGRFADFRFTGLTLYRFEIDPWNPGTLEPWNPGTLEQYFFRQILLL